MEAQVEQLTTPVDPAEEKVPALQVEHAICPGASMYFPPLHGGHTLAFSALLAVPRGQGWHVEFDDAEGVLLKRPGGQGLQVLVPGALQNPSAQQVPAPEGLLVPGAHAVQLALWLPPVVLRNV